MSFWSRSRIDFRHRVAIAIIALWIPIESIAAEKTLVAPRPRIDSLAVEPVSIVLNGSNRQQQLLVTGTTHTGHKVDVTRLCSFAPSDSQIVSVIQATVQGKRDGKAKVVVRYGHLSFEVSVEVRGFADYPPVHFANDVVPLFSKHGCNSGGCHGKASGQNGFRLSVFGFDPAADFDALVKESRGRRIFAASPENSLLLLKATGRIAHGGGRRIDSNSLDADVIRQWLRQGTPIGQNGAPIVKDIRVSPSTRVLGLKTEQQILATAEFSDGSVRDVTAAAAYSSNAVHVAEVDARGLVQTGFVAGEAAITVHYMGHVAAVRFQVPRPDAPTSYPAIPVNNKIDEMLWDKLRTMGILPSKLADDATFLRRMYIDVIGTLPRPDEVRAFLADRDTDKRRKWIDKVLDRSEYAAYWAMKWADILLVNRDKLGDRGAYEMHRWLVDQMSRNRPYDEWVRELITASGSSHRNGPVNFYRATATTEELTRAISQAFIGVRLECAQCHHHPFEKWGQDDFYGMAGFFEGVKRKKLTGDEELVFQLGGSSTFKVPATDHVVAVRPPGGTAPAIDVKADPRTQFAGWLTKPDNPWFARLVVNRLWKHFFGRGLVEPEDDLRFTNPPTNVPLLDYLTRTLIENRYDLKSVCKLILMSRGYQLSSLPNSTNKDDDQFASHHRVRRLPAEVLLDAICMVTDVPESFPGRPRGTRAIELWDNRAPSYFLDIFGRSERLSPCECARSSEPTMAQCLHLLNAPEIEEKIAHKSGRAARLAASKKPVDEVIEELCLAALGRLPLDNEMEAAQKLFAKTSREEAAQDFLWALLNSRDFLFSH